MSNEGRPSKGHRSLNERSAGEEQDISARITSSFAHDAGSSLETNSAPGDIKKPLESSEMKFSRERSEDSGDDASTEGEDEDDEEEDENYEEEYQERDGAGDANEKNRATFCEPGQIAPLPMIDEQNRMRSIPRPQMYSLSMPSNSDTLPFQAISTTQHYQDHSGHLFPRQYVQQNPTDSNQVYSQDLPDTARFQGTRPTIYGGNAYFNSHAWKPGTIPIVMPSLPYERTTNSRERQKNQTDDLMRETRADNLPSSLLHPRNDVEAVATHTAPRPHSVTSNPLLEAEFQNQANQALSVINYDPNLEFHRSRSAEANLWSLQHIETYSPYCENKFSGTDNHSSVSQPTFWPPQHSNKDQPGMPSLPEAYKNFRPIVTHPSNGSQIRARLMIHGNLSEVKKNWTLNETKIGRRLVRFERRQSGIEVKLYFTPISQKEYHRNMCAISCIWRKDTQEYLVTSVDCILLLELIICQKFSTEEKNRIRRNLEVCKPITISKRKPALECFFKKIMSFPPPRPRNIEKDVKVFLWDNLAGALNKIVSRYSAPHCEFKDKRQHDE